MVNKGDMLDFCDWLLREYELRERTTGTVSVTMERGRPYHFSLGIEEDDDSFEKLKFILLALSSLTPELQPLSRLGQAAKAAEGVLLRAMTEEMMTRVVKEPGEGN
jgi:hypothetical protein